MSMSLGQHINRGEAVVDTEIKDMDEEEVVEVDIDQISLS